MNKKDQANTIKKKNRQDCLRSYHYWSLLRNSGKS